MPYSEKIAKLIEDRKFDGVNDDYPRWIRFNAPEMGQNMVTDIWWEIVHIQESGIVTLDHRSILFAEYPWFVTPISDFGEDGSRLVLLSNKILEWAVFMNDKEMQETDQLEAADDQLRSYAN